MLEKYLAEAFQSLSSLTEDVIDINDEDMESKVSDIINDEADDSIDVIDVDADSDEDLEDSYIGKIIIECDVCHSKLYKDVEEVIPSDDDEDIVNVEEECPFCYSTDGYHIVGQVAPYQPEELSVEVEPIEKEKIASSGKDVTKKSIEEELTKNTLPDLMSEIDKGVISWLVDLGYDEAELPWYEINKYPSNDKKHISIEVKFPEPETPDFDNEEEEQEYWDTHFLNEPGEDEFTYGELGGLCQILNNILSDYDIDARFEVGDYSVGAYIDYVDDVEEGLGDAIVSGVGGSAIGTGVGMALGGLPGAAVGGLAGGIAGTVHGAKMESCDKRPLKHLKRSEEECYKEGFSKIELETDNDKIKVTSQPVEDEPEQEVLAPIAPAKEVEIDANSKSADDEDQVVDDVDIDELEEESLNSCATKYFKEQYKGAKSFKTSKIAEKNNQFIVEGILTCTSGRKHPVNMQFNPVSHNLEGSCKFKGNVKCIKENKAVNLNANLKGSKLIVESLVRR